MSRQIIIDVAVAVIIDGRNQVLITQRSFSSHQGGLWEFPGGKVEAGESAEQALIREIKEEVAIEVKACDLLCTLEHAYREKHIKLHVYTVSSFSGDAKCCESQLDLKWVDINTLDNFPFPEANQAIIKTLQVMVASPSKTAISYG